MRVRTVRITVVVVNLFAAVSAIAGAIGLVVGYMKIPLSVLETTPFADFTIPALLLGCVVGGSALVAAAIALFGPHRIVLFGWWAEPLAALVAGCIMVGWMSIEFALIGLGLWVQVVYFVVGLGMIGLAILFQWVESRQAPQRVGMDGGHHVGRPHAA